MRLRIGEAELRAAIERALIASPPEPDPDDLITLYLFLPAVVELPEDRRVRFRSSLEALLTDAHLCHRR